MLARLRSCARAFAREQVARMLTIIELCQTAKCSRGTRVTLNVATMRLASLRFDISHQQRQLKIRADDGIACVCASASGFCTQLGKTVFTPDATRKVFQK